MNLKSWILVGILVLVIVQGVSATTITINATHGGYTQELTDGAWTTVRNDVGDGSGDDSANVEGSLISAHATTDGLWNYNQRLIFSYNGSDIPDDAIIDSAVATFYGEAVTNGVGSWDVAMVDATPADPLNYVNGDYDGTTFTRMADTDLAYASFLNANRANNWALNAAGISNINTDTTLFSFMLLLKPDVDNSSPTWAGGASSKVSVRSVAYLSGTYTPSITITYHQPNPPVAAFSCTPLSGVAPLSVTCTDASTNIPTSLAWYNNTTAVGTATPQTFTISTVGSQDIKLLATNDNGSDWENKTAYITTYPAIITTYPMQFNNETRITPLSTNLPATGLNISVNASPDQYEASSFVLKPNTTLTDVTITATTLTDSDGTGHTAIPTSALDIKVVGVWYQADDTLTDSWYNGVQDYVLTPELLLNNKTILRVNRTAQTNEIWVDNDTYHDYLHVDNQTPAAGLPSDITIYDNATAGGFPQPFAQPANENQQIWVTLHVPAGQALGNYTGKIYVNSSLTDSVALNFSVRVPFALQNSSLEHAMYYDAYAKSAAVGSWEVDHGNEYAPIKPDYIIAAELADMKKHGILYPTSYNAWASSGTAYNDFGKRMYLQNQSGLPLDKFYSIDGLLVDYLAGGNQVALASNLSLLNTHADSYGIGDMYLYGVDEPSAAEIIAETPSFTTVIVGGSKIFYAKNTAGNGLTIANVTSMVNNAGSLNTTELALWRSANPNTQVFSYANPQAGVENMEIYRQNYGVALWVSGYDGEMDWAFQDGRGTSIWNDYDSSATEYRGELFTYPSTNGPLDTLQFEGLRQGIDDARIADTLSYITGNTTEATGIINAGIAAGQDMSVIRGNIIDHILLYGDTVHPTAAFTKSRSIVRIPQSITFTDTSDNTPTNWTWDFGDGQ